MIYRVKIETLQSFVTDILARLGTPRDIADVVAESLVTAQAMGVYSHGVFRLESYLSEIRKGSLIPSARPSVVRSDGSVAVLDGHHGFGMYAAIHASRYAFPLAKKFGISCIGVRHIHHSGMLQYITDQVAGRGLIGIAMVNTHPVVAYPGEPGRIIGTNPVSISIPGSDESLSLDFAISKVSYGKIREYAASGRKLEIGWATNQDGKPTTDPVEALKGSLAPFGDYKGFGIGMVVDILAGILTGSSAGPDVITWNDRGIKWNNGLLIVEIDPSFFIEQEYFTGRVSEYLKRIKSLIANGRIPGETRRNMLKVSRDNGVDLDTATVESLSKCASAVNMDISSLIGQ